MDETIAQEPVLLTFKATFKTNSGYRFRVQIQAIDYDAAYKLAQVYAAKENKKRASQRLAVVLTLVDFVRA